MPAYVCCMVVLLTFSCQLRLEGWWVGGSLLAFLSLSSPRSTVLISIVIVTNSPVRTNRPVAVCFPLYSFVLPASPSSLSHSLLLPPPISIPLAPLRYFPSNLFQIRSPEPLTAPAPPTPLPQPSSPHTNLTVHILYP